MDDGVIGFFENLHSKLSEFKGDINRISSNRRKEVEAQQETGDSGATLGPEEKKDMRSFQKITVIRKDVEEAKRVAESDPDEVFIMDQINLILED